ncbi:hypothetical protein BDR06DRAFT_968185 [Suillus hirtellus]|nr:hypothetical protein BDR06DRAFT_968185 [Suillus hirtellus]
MSFCSENATCRQYCEKNADLEHEKVQVLASLEQQHCQEVTAIQNQRALDFEEAQHAAHVEQDKLLAEKDDFYQCKSLITRQRELAEKEMELACLTAEYGSKIASLDNQIQWSNIDTPASSPVWRHLIGKRHVATCTNIIGFLPIPGVHSESHTEEPQTSSSGDAGHPLTSLLADVLIENAMVGMLTEALTKALQVQPARSHHTHSRHKIPEPPIEFFTDSQHRENKANVWDLFKEVFHLMKDDDYMLYEGASCKATSCFMDGMGPSPDLHTLQWDMTTMDKLDWNQQVIDALCSLYKTMQERNHLAKQSQQSIRHDIIQKFEQCHRCWRKACPQIFSDGTHKTMQQVGDCLVDCTNERLRMARVLSRRTTKFETRQKVTSSLLSDRKATEKEDLPVWVYLNSIVETLGKDGMSSDETIFTPRGNKPAKHLHNAKRESVQPAVAALPRAFYNPLWLNDQYAPSRFGGV